jgi:SAM-dependent methyltransferase
MRISRETLEMRVLRRLGFRDDDWGDWQGLASVEQLPRYDLIEKWRMGYKPSGSVLDLGCGEGIMLGKIQKSSCCGVIYHGIDLSKKAIQLANSRVLNSGLERFTRGDITDLCLVKNESFDMILFNEVLYYLPDPNKDPVNLMRKYEDHLKKGGLFLVSVWHDGKMPKEKNKKTWQKVEEAYGGERCLASIFVRKVNNSGWRIGLYSPGR